MSMSLTELFKATQLTKGGRLMEATRLIQGALGLKKADAAPREPEQPVGAAANEADVSDVPFREILRTPANESRFRAPAPAAPATSSPGTASPAPAADASAPTAPTLKEKPLPGARVHESPPTVEPAKPAGPGGKPRAASFEDFSFRLGQSAHVYRLYVPSMTAAQLLAAAPLPLVVLLHGCKQDAEDFALGTAMNALAEERKCLVLYPEQSSKANMLRCWNWFEAAHQSRDAGEPKLIAALTRQVIKSHHADASRVYIAGLSAGGAMAAVVAGLYPEMFAAVGVHSGLPAGAAKDMMSAFSAMKHGGSKKAGASGLSGATAAPAAPLVMPTIVFHGSADQTVNPDNGEHITDAAIAAMEGAGIALKKAEQLEASPGSTTGRRETLRTIYSAADGVPYVEYWAVGSGPHAWSGGDAAGSFTDPHGPSASQAMLDFFLKHRR